MTEVEELFVALVVFTRMKQHVPFCRELSMVCIEDRVFVDYVA